MRKIITAAFVSLDGVMQSPGERDEAPPGLSSRLTAGQSMPSTKRSSQPAAETTAPPGERPYHPGYCAAFVLNPDGNYV